MNYEINNSYHGFKLLESYEIKEVKSIANIFIHEKSGAKLLHLDNDDDDKVFSVSFRTPPSDSTGVPHIVEHCVLSGSRKYKTKEPFMDMVKGSLKTFINAMTFSDKTMYPVSSRNEKDFTNLMDVYLDSVFYPLIHEDKEIFMQEGWHYDIHDKNDPITYKGVVYNEMRGAYSSPNTLLNEVIGRSLFPDTTYKHSSGGNPDSITDLTLEDFQKFHKDYYHPTNSYIYIYGNGDLNKYLKHINDDYLSNFEAIDIDTKIPHQESFEEMNEINEKYEFSAQEDDSKKTYLSMNFVLGSTKDKDIHLVGDVLKEVLVSSSAGPVKKALLDAKIGEDIMCMIGGGVQPYLSIVAKNADIDQKHEFKSIIIDTLKKLVIEGIDKDLIESSINIAEYDLRETSGFATKGIIYHMLSMNSWLYDEHATELLAYDAEIKKFRDNISTDYYETYIKEHLIENKHSSIVTLEPQKGLSEEKAKLVEEKLKNYKESLSDDEIEELIRENSKLKEKQLSPDTEEALATIPKLEVSDVKKESEDIPREIINHNGDTIIKHEIYSNNLSYVELLFDTTILDKEEVKYLELLTILIGDLDTSQMTYGELSNAIYKLTGGINLSTRSYSDKKEKDKFYPKLAVSGKVVTDKIEDLLKLMNILIVDSKVEDKNRIKEVLLQAKSRYEMAINNRGDTYASRRLASYFSSVSKYNEEIKGFEFFWFISELVERYEKDSDEIINKLNGVYKKVFNRNNLLISYTGDQIGYDEFIKHYEKSLENISKEEFTSHKYSFDLEKLNEGVMSSSNVQYVTKGYNFKRLGYEYTGAMQVFRTILNSEYLHDRVRAKGGAYGCSLSVGESGNMIISSYRDPNLVETINVYDEAFTFIDTLDSNPEAFTKFIIGAISSIDGALTPRAKGIISTSNYIKNTSLEDIQEERNQILGVTIDDLKDISNILKKVIEKDYLCVYGNDVKIKAQENIFENVVSLNK